MFNDLKEMFRFSVEKKNLSLELNWDQKMPDSIIADENRINQVLINLLGNAVKFTTDGRILLSANFKNQQIIISVSDTGVGISQDKLETIFEAFVQSKTGIKTLGGTGLGLTISKKLAQLMNGDITLKSTVGNGSIFYFTFTYELGNKREMKNKISTVKVIELKADQPEVRVLIVDDNEQNREVVRLLMEPIGFIVNEAVNGIDAIKKCEQWSPHLILMDIIMPVMDGREATEIIKSSEFGKNVVIIAISASTFDEDRKKILSQGADAFIMKPFREAELLEEIGSQLELEYIYKDLISNESNTISHFLKDMDRDIISVKMQERLHKAVMQGDVKVLTSLIDDIWQIDKPLARALKNLLNDYKFEKIEEWLMGKTD